MILKLAHICFVTTDLPRMMEFYTNRLGLSVTFDFKNKEGEVFGCYIGCGDTTFIEIFDRDLKIKQWGGDVEKNVTSGQYNHFCLEITNLKGFKESLEGKGVTVSALRTGMDNSLQAWINDPDGNPIELMEYTPKSLQLRVA